MQLLPPPIEAVATDRGIDAAVMFAVEFLTVTAVIPVGFTHVLQFARCEFQDNDIVEVTDDRNLIRENVFGIAEIYEGRQDSLPVGCWQLPFVIGEHLQHGFEFRQSRGDEIWQRFAFADVVNDAANGLDDFRLVRAAYDVA